jgi:hypothetical protein
MSYGKRFAADRTLLNPNPRGSNELQTAGPKAAVEYK